jgi:outer membrane receptor protein involved in Fe transport
VDGMAALNAPKWKWNASATYSFSIPSIGGEMYVRGDYQHRSKTFYQLDHDPLATDAGYDIFNLSAGLTLSDRYEFRFFVNNLTNEYFCNNMVNGPYFRQGCQTSPINAQRRYGISARFNF